MNYTIAESEPNPAHRTTKTHLYFWSGLFSNWYPAQCEFMGIQFDTSEHLFMYLKAFHFKDEHTATLIRECHHPAEAKKFGRLIKGYDDAEWTKVRYGAMVNAVQCKFNHNPALRLQLLDTDNLILVEASPYDKVWGVGLAKENDAILDEKNWLGENLLGKALMEVRNVYRINK